MEIRLLKYVIILNETGSFTKAAESLHIAQPSLSQQIAKLERDLGVSLFIRKRGGITPTDAGSRFIERAKRIVQLDEDLEREMRERSEGMGNKIFIGTTAITGGHVLPPLLEVFSKTFPHVHVSLVEASTDVLEELTDQGEVDLSILSLPIRNPRLTYTSMLTEPLLLALPPREEEWMSDTMLRNISSDADAVHEPFHLRRLSAMPFIILKEGYGFRSTVLQICAENGFQPNVIYQTTSIETAQSLVAYGLGVTLIPQMVARKNGGKVPKYVSIASSPTRTLVFAYSKDRYLSLTARKFMEMFQQDISHL